MSNEKATELNTANQKLTELINELQVLEREYDQAVEHSASYFGNDDRIEQFRDDRAMEALNRVTSVKEQIENQTQLVRELAVNY
ncbi:MULTISPECIES: hypothetical protein [Vibrio]|uniref:hypothetical protein n=1 Tax=Vibrio TaxID=662 RepID=UPI001B304512|nr:hypothetical protein [Vibrio crassostreae]